MEEESVNGYGNILCGREPPSLSLSRWVADLPQGVLGGNCVEVGEVGEVDSQVGNARQTSSVHVFTQLLPTDR